MELSPASVDTVRPDAQRYTLGVLWIVALGILALSPDRIESGLQSLDTVASSVPHLTVPTFVVGFVLVVAGVVLPYCLAVAFTPFGFLVMNITLRVYRKVRPRDRRLSQYAARALVADLGTQFIPPATTWHVYVQVQLPDLARALGRRRQHLHFRASAILPASIVLGWLAYQTVGRIAPGTAAHMIGILVGASVFSLGAFQSNRQLHQLDLDARWPL